MSASPIRTRRWTRREYHRLIELGILHEDEPIELLGGQLVVSERKSSLHSTAVRLVAEALPGQILQSVNSRCLSSSACAEAERRVTSTNFSSMRCSRRASTSARVAITL